MAETKTKHRMEALVVRNGETHKERRAAALLAKLGALTRERWTVHSEVILDAEMFKVRRGGKTVATAYGMGAVLAYLAGLHDGLTFHLR